MSKTSTNVREFTLQLGQFVDKILPEQVTIFHQKVSMDLLRRIVMRNPVDTGYSRANWQAGTIPNEETRETPRDADATVQREAPNLSNLSAYAVVYLWNNVHYIVYLEDGTSQQAPEGFVALSIAEVEEMFR